MAALRQFRNTLTISNNRFRISHCGLQKARKSYSFTLCFSIGIEPSKQLRKPLNIPESPLNTFYPGSKTPTAPVIGDRQ
jgi:hypothetical protein